MYSAEELARRFKARGLKITPQRACIFAVLEGNGGHPTAEAVYVEAIQRMPTMSLKTVYQTLNDLAEMGEVQLLDLGTGSGRFDPNTDPHHHLVCTQCGKVRDLYVDLPGVSVPASLRQGFLLGAPEVIFRGVCAACQYEAAGPTRPVQHQQEN